jgi:hypothetical protein
MKHEMKFPGKFDEMLQWNDVAFNIEMKFHGMFNEISEWYLLTSHWEASHKIVDTIDMLLVATALVKWYKW